MTQLENDIRNCFKPVIGQARAKEILINSCLAAANGGELCSPALYGPKGNGKTHLKIAYAKALELLKFKHKVTLPSVFRKVDSADWAEVKNLLESDGYYFGLDEVHELFDGDATVQLKKIIQFLMRALDGNFKGGQLALADDFLAVFNRKRCAVSISSNRMGAVPEALRDRFEPIHLSLYTENELVDILQLMLKAYGLHGNEESLGIIARCGRGTARPMERIARTLNRNLAASGEDKKSINKEEIFKALKQNEMFPRGLSTIEVKLMKELANPMTRGMIKMRFPSLDNRTLDESLSYMLLVGFLEDSRARYLLSKKGTRYLESLAAEGFAVPAR